MRIRTLAWLALGVLVLGAGPGPSATDTAKQQLLQADRDFSSVTAEKGLPGFLGFLDDSVGTLRADKPVIHGVAGVGAVWKGLLENRKLALTWEPLEAHVNPGSDMGYTVGQWSLKSQSDTGWAPAGTGKYCTIWRRHKDGSWKVAFDSGVTDTPPDSTRK